MVLGCRTHTHTEREREKTEVDVCHYCSNRWHEEEGPLWSLATNHYSLSLSISHGLALILYDSQGPVCIQSNLHTSIHPSILPPFLQPDRSRQLCLPDLCSGIMSTRLLLSSDLLPSIVDRHPVSHTHSLCDPYGDPCMDWLPFILLEQLVLRNSMVRGKPIKWKKGPCLA